MNIDDSDRLDFMLKLLRQGQPVMYYGSSFHEMPKGGWVLQDGTKPIGWGAEMRDAIDAAMVKTQFVTSEVSE